ncbi:MAG: AraC family transcriptional regulator [Eubacterium sp.]
MFIFVKSIIFIQPFSRCNYKACKLLISSSLSLNEISNNLAYSSLSHFIGTFKKITGTTL